MKRTCVIGITVLFVLAMAMTAQAGMLRAKSCCADTCASEGLRPAACARRLAPGACAPRLAAPGDDLRPEALRPAAPDQELLRGHLRSEGLCRPRGLRLRQLVLQRLAPGGLRPAACCARRQPAARSAAGCSTGPRAAARTPALRRPAPGSLLRRPEDLRRGHLLCEADRVAPSGEELLRGHLRRFLHDLRPGGLRSGDRPSGYAGEGPEDGPGREAGSQRPQGSQGTREEHLNQALFLHRAEPL